jgi:hypothetical protein
MYIESLRTDVFLTYHLTTQSRQSLTANSQRTSTMPAQRTTTPRTSKVKSYASPHSSTDMGHHDSADERTPTLSPNGSDDNDRSSDFDPTFETPSKPGKRNAQSLYVFEDDDDEDMKPDLSDDEISYPGIVRDDNQQESEDEEEYGKRGNGKGKGKAQAKNTPKKTTPKKNKTSGSVAGGSGKKPGVAWIPEEDWVLFQKMHPKTSKPNWQEIADCVGRDAKVSCPSLTWLTSSLARIDMQLCRRIWRQWSRGQEGGSGGLHVGRGIDSKGRIYIYRESGPSFIYPILHITHIPYDHTIQMDCLYIFTTVHIRTTVTDRPAMAYRPVDRHC